jgi:hypothetical protein
VHYEVLTLGTRCVTTDGNSDARTHERSFLYLLTVFAISNQRAIRQTVFNRAAGRTTTHPITKNPKDVGADSHNSEGLPVR